MDQNAYVYAISVDGVTRYVGKGRGRRMFAHRKIAHKLNDLAASGNRPRATRFHRNLATALRRGAAVVETVLFDQLSDERAFELEVEVIRQIGLDILWNTYPGGFCGMVSEVAREFSSRPEVRLRHSEKMRRQHSNPESRSKLISGLRRFNAEHGVDRMREATTALWMDEKFRKKQELRWADERQRELHRSGVVASITDEKRELCSKNLARRWAENRDLFQSNIDSIVERRFQASLQKEVLDWIVMNPGSTRAAIVRSLGEKAGGTLAKLKAKGLISLSGGRFGRYFPGKCN